MPCDAACVICSKALSRQALKSHYFSKAHTSDIENAILKGRSYVEPWIAEYEAGKKAIQQAFVSLAFSTGAMKRYFVCIPCKYFGFTAKPHECTVENRKANVEYYKGVLSSAEKQQKLIMKPSMEVQTDPVEVGGSSDEVVKYQKKVDRLQKEMKLMSEAVEEADETTEGLYAALQHLQEYNLDVMVDVLKVLRRDYPRVYDKQRKNFGSEWDESIMREKAVEDP